MSHLPISGQKTYFIPAENYQKPKVFKFCIIYTLTISASLIIGDQLKKFMKDVEKMYIIKHDLPDTVY